MKFITCIVLSFLSTSVAFINTQILPTREFSKSLLFTQHNDKNENNRVDRFKEEAAKLRQEASEIEIALREEARVKGVPEEMINKLIPITIPRPTPQSASKTLQNAKENYTELPANTIRSKLGYLHP
jgi:hypothetical protein